MKDKNLLEYSDAYYENNYYYELFSIAEDYPRKLNKYLLQHPHIKTVLDAGCGTGKYTHVLEQISDTYTGIDLSINQLAITKTKLTKANSKLINTNLKDIPLPDNSVDLIVSCWVIGTIPDLEERGYCLKELKRVLKDNGKIIFIENSASGEFEILRNHHLDLKTIKYNNWLQHQGFIPTKSIKTNFNFLDINTGKKCIEKIYGIDISNKITTYKIKHDITIFTYQKTMI